MMEKSKKKLNSTVLILISVVLGLIAGLVFGEKATVLQPIGDIFLNLIKMLVIPLVMCSIATSVMNMKDMNQLGRVGSMMLALYIGTSALAAGVGIVTAKVAHLGAGVSVAPEPLSNVEEAPTVLAVITGMVPNNIIESMANFDTLPCITFSILFGIACVVLGEKAEPVKKVIASANEVLMALIGIVVKAAPIGVFALLASGIGKNGAEVLATLGIFVILAYIGAVILIILYIILVKCFSNVSIRDFLKYGSKVFITAFSTRSSSATLPVTISVTTNELQADSTIAKFMLPIGCTINMNGAALGMGLKAILAAAVLGMDLTLPQIGVAILISTLAGVGMPGVPNSGMVFNIFLFTSLGLPAGGVIGLLAGVENLYDMVFTGLNFTGDVVCTLMVDKKEKKRQARLNNNSAKN